MYGFNPLIGDGAPIIGAITNNDWYKFTTGQFAFWRYRDTPVVSTFQNRTSSEKLADIVDEADLRRELDHMRSLRTRPDEIDYMHGLRLVNHVPRFLPNEESYPRVFCDEYLDFMKEFQYPAYELSVTPDRQFDLRFPGAWASQGYWECPAMRVANTLRIRALLKRMTEEGQRRVYQNAKDRREEKIAFFRAHPWIKFIEFGFRRAGTPEWHDELDQSLFDALPPKQLLGVSELSAARRHGTPAVGTIPHEPIMVLQGIYHDEDDRAGTMESHQRFFWEWDESYKGEFSIALTDTYGSKYFFTRFPRELARRWQGVRQDSGSPIKYLDMAEEFYQHHGVRTTEKRVVPSDGLTTRTIHAVDAANAERFDIVNGLGTNLTFDFSGEDGVSPIPSISIVVKPVTVIDPRGVPHEVGKLTDNLAKAKGSKPMLDRLARLSGNFADKMYVEPTC